jgi:hypothetical protein
MMIDECGMMNEEEERAVFCSSLITPHSSLAFHPTHPVHPC